MRRVVLFLALSSGWCHGVTIESYALNQDSKKQEANPKTLMVNNGWEIDNKKDDNGKITEFQTKYRDLNSGISIIYLISMSLEKTQFFYNWGDRDSKICEHNQIRFEFDKNNFSQRDILQSSGKIWVDKNEYFDISKNIEKDFSGNYYFTITPEKLDQYLNGEKDLKIKFNNKNDIWLPFKGAKESIQKSKQECIEYLNSEKRLFLSDIEKANSKRHVQIEKENSETRKRNSEQQKLFAIRMNKPDVKIGMTRQQVVKNTRWGAPLRVNTTFTKYGTSEQWVYWGYKYLYFENGQLAIIQK